MRNSTDTEREYIVRSRSGTSGAQRVGAFTAVPSLLRELGANPDRVLTDAGLDVAALNDPEEKIPYVALGRLLSAAVGRTHCSHFGLLLGRACHVTDLGILGELMRNSPTVGEALRSLASFQSLNSGGVVVFVRETSNVVDFGCAIYEPGMLAVDQATDLYLAAASNFLRDLCGPNWSPTDVFLPHTRPANIVQHRHFFRVQPHFNADFCAIRFPAHWMRTPVAGADPRRLQAALAQARSQRNGDVVQAVRRTLRVLLLESQHSGDLVANQLGMHRRTLNRGLKAAGTTFQEQLDLVRIEAARQLLETSEVTLDDLAAVLGYSQISSFMRSFKRWTGSTPTQWRRDAHNDERFDVTDWQAAAHG